MHQMLKFEYYAAMTLYDIVVVLKIHLGTLLNV